MKGYDPASDGVIYTSQGGIVFFSDGLVGGTPDLILPDAIAEIKCPKSSTHLTYKHFVTAENFQDKLGKYYDQCQLNMYLADRDKCIFLSFDPRLRTEANRTHFIELVRDEERINLILENAQLAKELLDEL